MKLCITHPIKSIFALVTSVALTAGIAVADGYSIPPDKLDATRVLAGSASSFENPAEVNLDKVVRATPEYSKIKDSNIKRGTGEYWILLNKANERALRAVLEVHQDSEYDLVTAKGYLGELDPPISAEDITEQVLEKLQA